jgi:methionyl-tRNA synthetase
VNRYVTEQAPYKLKDPADRERLATILHVVAQTVNDCNLLLSPFLPHSANRIDAALGGDGAVAPMPRIDEVDDLDGGPGYPVITGDYSGSVPWRRRPITVGTPIGKPSPIFAKLDPSVVDEELARLGLSDEA